MSTTKSTESRASPHLRHKTLSAYYDNIQSISSFFSACPGLSLKDDPPAYGDFLQSTLCARNTAGEEPDRPAHGPCEGSQQDAIDRALSELAWRAGVKNVLLLGDKRPTDLPVNIARPGVDKRTVDSPSAILRSTSWAILRSRIGNAAFRHLLIHTSIFLPIGNNCFMQLSGTPVYDLYENGKTAPSDSDAKSRSVKRRREDPGDKSAKRRKHHGESTVNVQRSRPGSSPADTIIPRQRMFYGQPTRKSDGKAISGLPPLHILNQIKASGESHPDDAACLRLFVLVFPQLNTARSSTLNDRMLPGNPKRTVKMLGAMREMWLRHHRLDYRKYLRLCLARAHDHTLEGLQPISHKQIGRFVTSILKDFLPTAISGSQENLQTICYHARRSIKAKQFEPVSLHSIMQNLRVTDFGWVGIEMTRINPAEMSKRRELVEQFMFWLFNDYLIPLLKNTFYITETAQTRYETLYYAHDEWMAATKPHYGKLEEDHLERLNKDEGAFALQGPLGVSAVRLIPKPNGFRPIVNLGRQIGDSSVPGISTRGTVKSTTANQALRGVHQILVYEKDRKRDILGSSLFGTNEIFAPIQTLRSELLKLHGYLPRLYFVKMDIKAAFDTIKQDKMMEVITRILNQDHDYVLMLYCLLLPPASEASQGSARRLFKTRAVADDGLSSGFGELARDVAKPLRNALIVDMARRKTLSRKACLELLHTHIKNNVWQIGSKLFRQKEGIPQGSKISSILCSTFYAALENEHLSYFTRPGSRLLRYIDDFLYVTDDYSLARRFISVMSRGFPEYGAFISPNKTLVSFEYAYDGHVVPVCAPDRKGRSYFPFCGFLIDCQTLEMSMDTPRMIAGHMEQSFALRFARHRGAAFVGWLSRQLENRNHIAYLDTKHNTLDTVHLNIYLNFATTAMKIPHYFPSSEELTPRTSKLIFESIQASVGYTYIAGKARVRHASRGDIHPDRHYVVRKKDFEYLAQSAVLNVLRRKVGRFKDVVHLFDLELAGRQYSLCRDSLAEIVRRGQEEVKNAKY